MLQTLSNGSREEIATAEAALQEIPEFRDFSRRLEEEEKAELRNATHSGEAGRVLFSLMIRLLLEEARDPYGDHGAYGVLEELLGEAEPCAFASIVADIPAAIPNLVAGLEMKRPPEAWPTCFPLRILALFGPHAAPATPAIARKLIDDDSDGCGQSAAKTLSKIGPHGHDALPDLLVAARSSNPRVRAAVVDALVAIAPTSDAVRAAIEEAAEDSHADVRAAAQRARGQLGQ